MLTLGPDYEWRLLLGRISGVSNTVQNLSAAVTRLCGAESPQSHRAKELVEAIHRLEREMLGGTKGQASGQ